MDKEFYDLLIREGKKCRINDAFLNFAQSKRSAIIYGAGRQSRIVLDFCTMFGKDVICLMTTAPCIRWGLLPQEKEMPMYQPESFRENHVQQEYDVITAVGDSTEEIAGNLKRNGYANIYVVNDWDSMNNKIRKLFYDCYLEYHGAKIIRREKDCAYMEYVTAGGKFRTCYPEEHIFQSNVLGEFNNIIMPSIFNDFVLALQGPYELQEKDIAVRRGDIVFDLGANVGLFSCVASAKGCEKVYAFEPMPYILDNMLCKNAELNPVMEIIPKAVGECCGKVPFYCNDKLQQDADTCRGSVHRELEPEYEEIEVEQITIDSFVREKGLTRVDYIKSHIEYTENNMLRGATDTLSRFEPKLAFYSQRALGNDRYLEIEKLILKANPNYRFIYKWRRMFAYVFREDKPI